MKKLIAKILIVTLVSSIVGCSSNPSKGHYYTDASGQTLYAPSAEAENADTWSTIGIITGAVVAVAGLATGIVALTK